MPTLPCSYCPWQVDRLGEQLVEVEMVKGSQLTVVYVLRVSKAGLLID